MAEDMETGSGSLKFGQIGTKVSQNNVEWAALSGKQKLDYLQPCWREGAASATEEVGINAPAFLDIQNTTAFYRSLKQTPISAYGWLLPLKNPTLTSHDLGRLPSLAHQGVCGPSSTKWHIDLSMEWMLKW